MAECLPKSSNPTKNKFSSNWSASKNNIFKDNNKTKNISSFQTDPTTVESQEFHKDICAKKITSISDFIFNSENKFKINSIFDYKGAKEFIKSKKIALQEIKINFSSIPKLEINDHSKRKSLKNTNYMIKINYENKNIKMDNKNNNKAERKSSISSKNIMNKKNLSYVGSENKDKYSQKTKSNKKKLYIEKGIDIGEERKKRKSIKGLSLGSKYNEYEIKMFKDKSVKTIKPIKLKIRDKLKDNNTINNKNNKRLVNNYASIFSDDSISSKESLFKIVSKINEDNDL